MKKVLIITYYWYPSGGNGVQRWVKFSKYLREYGWEPVIYTVKEGEYPVLDHSLKKDISSDIEVIRHPIWEPYTFYKLFVGKKKNTAINRDVLGENRKLKFSEKVAVWIRGNLFIPDARRFWIRPSVMVLSKYLKSHPVDAIISTGPPHSMHLIALGLKKKFNIPWIADFRDPWTTMDYIKDLKLSDRSFRKHLDLEKKVLNSADAVVAVGHSMKEEFKHKTTRPVSIITNGFDESDFESKEVTVPDSKFTLVHVGSLLERRNPHVLWEAMADLVKTGPELESEILVKLIGRVDPSVHASIKKYKLEKYVEIVNYIPHEEVIKELKKAEVLLLLVDDFEGAKWVLTGKIFEYLYSQRPVLCVGPRDGDAGEIIIESRAGEVVEFGDIAEMKRVLKNMFEKFKQGDLASNAVGINKYSRKELTGKLAELLEKISK